MKSFIVYVLLGSMLASCAGLQPSKKRVIASEDDISKVTQGLIYVDHKYSCSLKTSLPAVIENEEVIEGLRSKGWVVQNIEHPKNLYNGNILELSSYYENKAVELRVRKDSRKTPSLAIDLTQTIFKIVSKEKFLGNIDGAIENALDDLPSCSE